MKLKKRGGLNEKTVRIDYNSMWQRWFVTVSNDGHNVTSVPALVAIHRDNVDPLVAVYVAEGYTQLCDQSNGR